METWDVIDRHGRPKGRTIARGDRIAPGDFHLVAHVWIRNSAGRWLIQRRADHVEWLPGIWDTTGGSALAGEDSRMAAIRETSEELGLSIQPSQLCFAFRWIGEDSIADVWVLDPVDIHCKSISVGSEVAAVKWATNGELAAMIESRTFFDYGAEYFAGLGIAR